jgi:3-oxoacyl-[acyl-carrier protein] reductase
MGSQERFSGKTAVITGGGGHIGRFAAHKLASEGCSIAICDISLEKAKAVASEIKKNGGKAKAYKNDVRSSADVERTIKGILNHFGCIDILICCAGGSTREKMRCFCDQTEEVIHDNINVNLFGSIHFAHKTCRHMISNHYGRIVFIALVLGIQGQQRTVEYSAAKGGIIAMTKALAMELGDYGITVNAVSPGLVERGQRDVSHTNYIGRNCTGDDIAGAIAYLASDEASFVTGANLVVDGGWGLGVQSHVC